jgi:hypothetical protein
MDKNIAEDEVQNLRQKLEELEENDGTDNDGRHTKRHRSVAPDDEGQEAEESVRQAGHYFFLVCGPWLRRGEKIFQTMFDDNYTEKTRFENGGNKIQGQLRDIQNILPEKFRGNLFTSKWLSKTVCLLCGWACCGLDSEFQLP